MSGEDYSLEKYVLDCEETLALQRRLLEEYERDVLGISKQIAEVAQALAGHKENRRYLKEDAPVVTLFGGGNQPGRFIESTSQIEDCEAAISELKTRHATASGDVEQAKKAIPVLIQRLEIARTAQQSTGKLIEAAHRFKRHYDDTGSEAEN